MALGTVNFFYEKGGGGGHKKIGLKGGHIEKNKGKGGLT